MINKILGKRLRKLREKRGLSQEKLGLLSGLDRTYISGIESGKRNPSVSSLSKLLSVLDVKFEDLFKGL